MCPAQAFVSEIVYAVSMLRKLRVSASHEIRLHDRRCSTFSLLRFLTKGRTALVNSKRGYHKSR